MKAMIAMALFLVATSANALMPIVILEEDFYDYYDQLYAANSTPPKSEKKPIVFPEKKPIVILEKKSVFSPQKKD